MTSRYRVVVTARNTTHITDFVEEHRDKALAVQLDVSKPDQMKAAVLAAEERLGRVDLLVNNAGYGYLAAIEEGEDADIRALFETDLFGPVNLIKAVLFGMRTRQHGHIVNISSIGGLVTYPGVATTIWSSSVSR